MKLQLRKTQIGVAVVALALTASGCAHVGRAGVGVQNLTANVVFGVKKPQPAAAPSNFPSFLPPDLVSTSTTRKPFPNLGAKAAPDCRVATVSDFPRAASEAQITKERPAAGQYRWKRDGTYTPNGSKIVSKISGFEQRELTMIGDVSPDPKNGYVDFSYQTSQPDLVAPNVTVVTTWHVRHLTTDDPGGLTSIKGNRVAQGGIYITKIERHQKTGAGELVTEFNPTGNGVLYMPLPVDLGLVFNSVGVDPKTLDTFQNKGSVVKKEQIDACGSVIDTYRLETDQSFTSGSTTSSQTYAYNIATSMGGVLVMEAINGTVGDGSKLKTTNHIAQVDPSPAPVPAA